MLELGYNIDYEDEKESFEVDEADTVELVNGERMPWEQVKRDGIDYIALYYVNDKGKQLQILDAELAWVQKDCFGKNLMITGVDDVSREKK